MKGGKERDGKVKERRVEKKRHRAGESEELLKKSMDVKFEESEGRGSVIFRA